MAEHLFTVDGSSATPATRIRLTEAGLMERQHLQEWVLQHPEIIGEDVRIVTFEFDRWATSGGAPTWERLDVLGLDQSGRLVVAELKRDRASDSVMVQALNYAAMASRFSLDLLVEAYGHRRGDEPQASDPLDDLREWAPTLSDETLGPPRIVLVAEEFGPVLTNTAMFLIEQGLDLRLVRINLYRFETGTLVLTAAQLLPVPDAEDFMVRPRSAVQTQRATRAATAKRLAIPHRLIAAGVFSDGQELRLRVPPGVGEDQDVISAWLDEEPDRQRVRWWPDPITPVEWVSDGQPWNMTALVRHVIEQATGEPPRTKPWGPNWFQTLDGEVLYKIAEALSDDDIDPGAGFNWAPLHDLLAAVPRGRWTTYGDLAAMVGTAAQPLGSHISSCRDCPNVRRVLGNDGRPRANVTRFDPTDERSQEQWLADEGIAFANGAAEPASRLSTEELNSLAARTS